MLEVQKLVSLPFSWLKGVPMKVVKSDVVCNYWFKLCAVHTFMYAKRASCPTCLKNVFIILGSAWIT